MVSAYCPLATVWSQQEKTGTFSEQLMHCRGIINPEKLLQQAAAHQQCRKVITDGYRGSQSKTPTPKKTAKSPLTPSQKPYWHPFPVCARTTSHRSVPFPSKCGVGHRSFGCRGVEATLHCCRSRQPLGLRRHAPRKMPPFIPNNCIPLPGGIQDYNLYWYNSSFVDQNVSSDCRCVLGLLPLLLMQICSGINAYMPV